VRSAAPLWQDAGVPSELPDKVLVVRLGAIGDVVNAQVVANAIREARPRTQIGWVVHDLARPLVEGHPSVDRVHVWRRGCGLGGWLALVRELRAERYGLALDLQRIAKSGLLARASGAPRVLGFDRARSKELGWMWSTERIASGRADAHRLEWYLEFAEHLGLARPSALHRLPRDEAAARWAEGEVAALGSAPVLLNVGASKPPNRWPPERFGALAQALARALDAPVGWTGGPGDKGFAERAQRAAGAGTCARSWVGSTSLLQLAELARRARLFVSCDTGPMHLAAAVGAPVVALFGPADPRRTGPWGPGQRVVQSPSGRMEDLLVEPVLAAALERAKAGAPAVR
jgi:heptosyltransferase-1